ncbi:MAG: tetratricopeptide repeat protein [Casimicrobiaceae bacterium]
MRFSFVFVMALLCATPAALAQSVSGTNPGEFTGEARRIYAEQLKSARALIGQKQFMEAIAILDRLTTDRPREPQARFLKGVALTDSDKLDEAITTFRGVLADFPELPEPYNNLAVLYARKGEYELARIELEAAIKAAPDYGVAYENLGDVHARLAAQNYERALARDSKNKTAPAKLKVVRDILATKP